MFKDLFAESYYHSIPDDDLISKQRYRLFRTTSFIGSFACLVLVFQALSVFTYFKPIVVATLVIGSVFLINLVALNRHKNPKLAYIIIGITSTLIIHLNMYDQGGLRASASYYMAPVTLMIFMLLGNKTGRLIFTLVLANIIFFFLANEYTHWITWDIIGNTEHDKNVDYLITAICATFILGAQISYLESGKNVVIQRITEQRNELRVKNLELKKLSMVASKADNAIIITNDLGNTEWVNDGFVRLTGFSFEEVIGKKPYDLLCRKETNQDVLIQLKLAISERKSFNGELLKFKKDGKRFWSQITMTPITSDDNNDQQFIFIESDITPRKIAEEKMNQYLINLEKTNQELDKFAYVVSHDLKAPLRAIGNLTGWIEEDMGDRIPEDMRGHFNTIKGRVVRMEGLIDGILDYTKASKGNSQWTSVDSSILVREAMELIEIPTKAVVNIRNNMPVINAQTVKIQQIFMNLINNAIRYNDKEDIQVEVGCEDQDSNWMFYVKDNGPGIEKRYHEKIFVIFQTLNARDEVEAKGVGLAIVKKIIEEEGGSIWIESEKNKGSKFCFTWPKIKKEAFEESLLIDNQVV